VAGPEQVVYPGERAEAGLDDVPGSVLLPGHDVPLGRFTTVRRLLPHRQRRLIGAWCFVDSFGPDLVAGQPGMQVPPHPHCGLQTVTWLVAGEIAHRDSLGNARSVTPGGLHLMTSGHGIAHSEQSPREHPDLMHGLQLWVALPDGARDIAPAFDSYEDLPTLSEDAARVSVVVGEYAGARSPARVHTPLLGLEAQLSAGGRWALRAAPRFEHGLLVLTGSVRVAGTLLERGSLLYVPPQDAGGELPVEALEDSTLFVVGGEPFDEPLVMWWNFVARTHEEIVAARDDWAAGRRFGQVGGCERAALPAPTMPGVRLKARDRHGGVLS